MILRYAKYLDLPFHQVIHITIVWIIKTPFDVFAWQPLRPLKTDPGQRMERSFLFYREAGGNTELQRWNKERNLVLLGQRSTEHCHLSDSVSACQGTLTPACWSLMGKGVPSAVSPLPTWCVHRSPTQTHKPWAHHWYVRAGKQEAMEAQARWA